MKRLTVLALALMLTGCLPAYVAPPQGASSVTISFAATGEPTLGFGATLVNIEQPSLETCSFKISKIAQIYEGNPFAKTDNPPEIPIPAKSLVGLRAFYIPANTLGQYGCTRDVYFIPEQNSKYKITAEWTHSSCNVKLESLDNGQWGPVDSKSKDCIK